MSDTRSVTMRLPQHIVEILDSEAEKRGTNRTEVTKRAVLVYKRLQEGVFVPLTQEYKRSLLTISEARNIPYEQLLNTWICKVIEDEGRSGRYRQHVMTTRTDFIPVVCDDTREMYGR